MYKNKNFKIKIINNKFSMRIKDIDPKIEQKNFSIYLKAILGLVVFLITLLPFYAYLHLIFKHESLSFYFANYSIISKYVDLPSKSQIWGLAISALVFMAIVITMFISFKALVNMSNNKRYKQAIIALIIIFGILTILFQGISQYFYGYFQDFFNYQVISGLDNKISDFKKITTQFIEFEKNTSSIYNWIDVNNIWWIIFVQIFLMFVTSISLQNITFFEYEKNSEDKYINYFVQKNKVIYQNRIKLFVNNLFSFTDKTLSNWLIILVLMICFPILIYIVAISTRGSEKSLIYWTHQLPNLLKDYQNWNTIFDQYKNQLNLTKSSPLLILSSPIIFLGITLSTVLFLLTISIRGQKSSQLVLRTKFILLSILISLLILSIFISQLELHKLLVAWNTSNNEQIIGSNYIQAIKQITGQKVFENIDQKLFLLNNIDQKIDSIFNDRYIISVCISFLVVSTITGFCIILKGMLDKRLAIDFVKNQFKNKKLFRK
ncbi:hypothetical protein [Mycoplasma mycoides]|uniref:hypothetical protein n=1 Tax=Mycoplasma mycoides TaxID=2102 RepID=UPI00223FF92F|nr:hypothetical protein [Mycoplasma mycoides]QVK02922.1 hypothetical protein I7637_00640 [Mycoplasma mycoides subsp. capri]QVK03740.1 hypothetical protein I7638_00645 [Mycoplasma mycoides subsp. capri]